MMPMMPMLYLYLGFLYWKIVLQYLIKNLNIDITLASLASLASFNIYIYLSTYQILNHKKNHLIYISITNIYIINKIGASSQDSKIFQWSHHP